jgi:hypothetical protein
MTNPADLDDFEAFWRHFLTSHRSPATRWAHVAALALGLLGAGAALRRRPVTALLLGGGAVALAVLSHPLFEGNWPENFGRPVWAARAFLRLCLRTVSGAIAEDLANLDRGSAA